MISRNFWNRNCNLKEVDDISLGHKMPGSRPLRTLLSHLGGGSGGGNGAPTHAANAAGDDGDGDDVVTDDDDPYVTLPLFCMGTAPFEEAARDHNGYRSVALNLFEPRYTAMAKKVLTAEGADQMFGYMERAPQEREDGNWDFVGEVGVMGQIIWHRWLEKAGAGGRVAIEVVRSQRFKVVEQWTEDSGVEGVPPLAVGKCELLPLAEEDGLDLDGGDIGDGGEPFLLDGEDPLSPENVEDEYTMTSSSATTQGVTVTVRTGFQGVDRVSKKLVWAYEVTVHNENEAVKVKLLTRHFIITDSTGRIEEVGPGAHGVLGEQPEIEPKKSIRYVSSTPLRTEYGTMEGSFEFAVVEEPTSDEAGGDGGGEGGGGARRGPDHRDHQAVRAERGWPAGQTRPRARCVRRSTYV
eukprot:SAG22_NODE_699_length_7801_cov_6.003116_1_plen_409_part_00